VADRAALGAAALAVLALVLLPLGDLFGTALSSGIGPATDALAGPAAGAALVTLLIALAVCIGAVLVGTAGAFLTERTRAPGRGWIRLGMLLPLVVPGFVSALAWIDAYGPGGLLHDIAGVQLPGLFGGPGIVLVLVVEAPAAWKSCATSPCRCWRPPWRRRRCSHSWRRSTRSACRPSWARPPASPR
jgi:iron(III) transport system permease protein